MQHGGSANDHQYPRYTVNMENVRNDCQAYMHAAAMACRSILMDLGEFNNLSKAQQQWSMLRAMEDDWSREAQKGLANLSLAMTILAGYGILAQSKAPKMAYAERARYLASVDVPVADGVEYILLRF